MSGIGIQDFRSLITNKGDLENRRVTIDTDQNNGSQSIRAPNSLWGRICDWFSPSVSNNVARENQEARQTFYDALVKAEGKEFAEQVIQSTLGMTGEQFVQTRGTLQASTIKQIINKADTERERITTMDGARLNQFIDNNHLSDVAARCSSEFGFPDLEPDDPDLVKAFRDRVRMDPDFGHKLYSFEDLQNLARDAVRICCETKQAKFDEQFPALSKLENGHPHDMGEYFDNIRSDLRREPLGQLSQDQKQWVNDSLDGIETSTRLLSMMTFNVEDIGDLKSELLAKRNELVALRDTAQKEVRDQVMDAFRQSVFEALGPQRHALAEQICDVMCQRMEDDLSGVQEDQDLFENGDFDLNEWFEGVDKEIDNLLTSMDFQPKEREEILGQINDALSAKTEALEDSLLEEFHSTSGEPSLRPALDKELGHQINLLESKVQFLDEYVRNDPLSEKNVAYNRLVLAQSSMVALQDVLDQLNEKLDHARDSNNQRQIDKLTTHINVVTAKLEEAKQRVTDFHTAWQDSGTERSEVSPKKALFKTHPFEAQRKDEERFLKAALEEAKILVPGGAGEYLKRKQVKALDTIQDWQPIERDMIVSREGVTRSYTSKITPGMHIGHGVGEGYQRDGLRGVSAGNKSESGHARNLQVSELFRNETDPDTGEDRQVLVSRTIRHGVLDPWTIKDKQERQNSANNGAREVLTAGIVSNEKFLEKAKENSRLNLENGEHPVSRQMHVNLNLTTADTTLLRKMKTDYKEHDFTDTQFRAFQSQNGPNQFNIDGEDVYVNVDTITFSFGVNSVAMGEGIWGGVGEDELWPPEIIEHNRQNLNKLLGDLTENTAPGGYIGGLVDRLKEEAAKQDISQARREQLNNLVGQIQRETDTVRNVFNTESYQHGIEDAYKMDRHIMGLCNLGAQALEMLGDDNMLMSVSQGCKSNKDRGGMGDVEHKSQMIIEDMGGRVRPGRQFEEQDQIIYNTVLTSSGQDQVQQQNTGLPGSKNAKELEERINDPYALEYSRGFSSFTKA